MRKRIVLPLCVLLLCIVSLAAFAQEPETITSGDFQYILVQDGTACITDYTGAAAELTIPALLDGYVVSEIGREAFKNYYKLTDITVPSEVFGGCGRLTNIHVASNNPAYVSVNGVLFDKEQKLLHSYPGGRAEKQYDIPYGTTSIGDLAFSMCSSLSSITIPDTVTNIGLEAFFDCHSLTTITIPDSVVSIGKYAFSLCSSLTLWVAQNSYAQSYAEKNQIPYALLPDWLL